MKRSEILKKLRTEFEKGGRPVNLSELAAIALMTVEDAGMVPPAVKIDKERLGDFTYVNRWESEDVGK